MSGFRQTDGQLFLYIFTGVLKKIKNLAKKSAFKQLADWASPICNHLYWCVSTSAGKASLVKEKWTSMLNHVCNKHNHDNEEYKQCVHGELEDRDWIMKGETNNTKLNMK